METDFIFILHFREDVPNTIEKACENPEFSEEKSDDDEVIFY